MPKDFISFLDYSEDELQTLLDLALVLRRQKQAGQLPHVLRQKSLALLWDAEGFRNRVAFELGIQTLGGLTVQVPGRLDEREMIEDVAAYLDNWFDAVICRTREHSHLLRLAAASKHPVINARTSFNHPCEILGDLAYIYERRGRLEGLKVAFVGEATNLCHPWFEAAARLPIEVVQICPPGYAVDADWLAARQKNARGELWVTPELNTGLINADVIYTDCWPAAADEEAQVKIRNAFLPYQITPQNLALMDKQGIFLPCPPVHRGQEVSAAAMTSPLCHVIEAKEYLLHAQNAVLVTLLS